MRGNVLKLVEGFNDNVVVFYADGISPFTPDELNGNKVEDVAMPQDASTSPKQKNFILRWAKQKSIGGFLHIVEDTVALDKDPSSYIASIQRAMDVLDYDIHFSTVTDPCNYVFKKFCPRLTIRLDDEEVTKKLGLSGELMFTSHSNTFWTIYNMSKDIQEYDEKFTIAMFYIIEYLARRKATKHPSQLYFMNQYLCLSSEVGTFHNLPTKGQDVSPETMQEEDMAFKKMGVDYAPDNNLDQVLDILYMKLKEKMV